MLVKKGSMKHTLSLSAFLMPCLTGEIHAQEESTWGYMQQEIFDNNCIVCHTAGTSFANQSGLILTEDVSYGHLIDATPRNVSAAAEGLVRVSSEGGISAPHKSFLWEKVNAPEQNHFYTDHPNYGAIMPLDLPSLTNGQLAFVKAWIEAGALESGLVADTTLLDDTTRYVPPEFLALELPSNGFQFHLGPFDVWPAQVYDREFLYFEPFPTRKDLYVSRYEISFRPGSHHFILYNYPAGNPSPEPEVYRDLRDSLGNINLTVGIQLIDLFPFFVFVGTQTPFINYHFPPGVALRLPPGSGFDLNSHSVNRSDEIRIGEVYANIHTVDQNEIWFVADYANFGNFNINLPPNQITALSETFYFKETRHIIQMWSHSHEHTVEFMIEGVGGEHDGELLYWTNDWEHPSLLELYPPLTMKKGEGLRLTTTYNNWTDRWITYGPLSSDEMQFLFYIYYTNTSTTVSATVDPVYVVPGDEVTINTEFPNPRNHSFTASAMVRGADESVLDSVALFDDGAHSDGDASDGLWGGSWSVPTEEKTYSVDVNAVDADSGLPYMVYDAVRFTTIGPVVYDGLTFLTDSIPNPGDNLVFRVYLRNDGSVSAAQAVTIELTSTDTCVLSLGEVGDLSYDDIGPGETATTGGAFALGISESCPGESDIPMQIAIASDDYVFWSDSFSIHVYEVPSVATADQTEILPEAYALHQNYPNPFNPITSLRYDLPERSHVELVVYDILGRKVRTLVNEVQDAGYKSVIWDATDEFGSSVPSGMHIYRISARSLETNGKFSQTHKMVLLR